MRCVYGFSLFEGLFHILGISREASQRLSGSERKDEEEYIRYTHTQAALREY